MARKKAKKQPKKKAVQIGARNRVAMQECIVHARDLLKSARAVQAEGHPNIAYHLATLALEEIGGRGLIALCNGRRRDRTDGSPSPIWRLARYPGPALQQRKDSIYCRSL